MASLLFRKSARKHSLIRRIGWQVEAALLGLFWAIARRLPVERASAFGASLLSSLGPRLNKQKHVLNNLSVVLGTQDQVRLRSTARQVWGNFGAVLAEYPHLETFSKTRDKYLQVTATADTQRILNDNTPAIYVTSHMANWELPSLPIVLEKVTLNVVYSPLSNPVIDEKIQTQRQALGCRFVSKQNVIRHLVKALRNGESIGLLSDGRIDEGEMVDFFGHKAMTATTPAWLSLKLGCPIVPVQIQRTGNARYRIVFHDPLSVADHSDSADPSAVLALTRRLNAVFEDWIREQPGQWMCTKRRWPKAVYKGSTENAESPTL